MAIKNENVIPFRKLANKFLVIININTGLFILIASRAISCSRSTYNITTDRSINLQVIEKKSD